MWISRVRVNGGFLAGLDVALTEGLNVVVGPRGAGKTTFLELIRHALGVQHADAGSGKRRSEMIDMLLGNGEVILDLQDQHASYHVVVDRAGQGRDPATVGTALVLGQNELEQIASSADSRLSLIDLRAGTRAAPPDVERAAELTFQAATLRADIETLSGAQSRRQVVRHDRELAATREGELMRQASAQLTAKRVQLQGVENQVLQLSQQLVAADQLRDLVRSASATHVNLDADVQAMTRLDLGVELTAASDAPRTRLADAVTQARAALNELEQAVVGTRAALAERRDALRLVAEPIRAELEAAEAGLGQVTAEIRNLDAELAGLDLSVQALAQAIDSYQRTRAIRDEALDEYEAWQEGVYQARLAIAQQVSTDLEQHVVVEVEHLSHTEQFRNTLNTLLQGSGLQYRQLAEKVAGAVLPRQLLRLVEDQDTDQLATLIDIPTDRAARLLGALQIPESLRALAAVHANDRVDFLLMSPAGPKRVESLSTGQKCAVTLPIALTERTRVLVLDQPEDHLDNAYLVTNVLTALEVRNSVGAQTIVATHNANIPVLGGATTVVSLTSDGASGSVDAVGPYDQDDIVEIITKIMEGGRQAFLDRANFYSEHDPNG